MAGETKLGNPALEQAVAATGDPDLKQALAWSLAVNKTIAEMVRGVPPFPNVRACLDRFSEHADMLVCSQTPNAALEAEWNEHGIAPYVQAICGQEIGSKKETLAACKDKYATTKMLMIGDAPGDYKAAAANNAFFFPINPGHEEASWTRLLDEGIERFFTGTFAGVYQQRLLEEFDSYLPERPPWPVHDEHKS
jgi:phosphoglycolate phosphatase-like HAD superfamily hydrolase